MVRGIRIGLGMGSVGAATAGGLSPGYSAFFDADVGVFSDVAGTAPAVNAGPVRNWTSVGTAGSVVVKSGGSTHPILRGSAGQRYLDGGAGGIDTAFQDTVGMITRGLIPPTGQGYTVMCVAWWNSANDTAAWGNSNWDGAELRGIPEMATFDNSGDKTEKAGDFSGQVVIVTCVYAVGPGGSNLTRLGVNDTRDASLSGPVAFVGTNDTGLMLLGGLSGRFLAGRLYACGIWPTEQDEAARKLSEKTLASRYGAVLPY